MRTVRDAAGNRYFLVERSGESTLVRDPETGERRSVPTEGLGEAPDEPPLETAAHAVPEPVRRTLAAARDDRSLGLLVALVDRGPTAARTLVETTGYCESDLVGQLSEYRAAGLVASTTVADERGYEATDDARRAVALLTAGESPE